jgi:hypothetical protein
MVFCFLALSRFIEQVPSSDHDLMLNVLHSRNSRELQATERRHFLNLHDNLSARNSNCQDNKFVGHSTHALLNSLNIIITDPNPPRSSEMPTRLSW